MEYQFHLPKYRNKNLNQRNENEEDEEDDDENVYAVRQVDDDDEEGENEDDNENALINPGKEVEDPIWPLLIGRAVFRRFRRRRRGRRGGWRRRRGGRPGVGVAAAEAVDGVKAGNVKIKVGGYIYL